MRKVAQLLVAASLLSAVALPAGASGDMSPRQLQASSCTAVKINGKSFILYRNGLSCSYSKRWARKVAATRGRSKPRGYKCTSGSKFRGGGYCQKGSKHFGWYRGE
jgi:hypothetical protein